MQPAKSNEVKFFFHGTLFECHESVYYPSEDSYFLAENVFPKQKSICIDVGCGSGIQTLNLLYEKAHEVTAIDLNPIALEATKKNCEKAGFGKKVKLLQSDLFENYKGKKADLIVFNPPYVPSESGEGKKYLDLDGGKKGRETIDRFLEQFPMHLKGNGEAIFLQTNINGLAQTKKMLAKKGFEFSVIARRKDFFEELCVCKSTRKC